MAHTATLETLRNTAEQTEPQRLEAGQGVLDGILDRPYNFLRDHGPRPLRFTDTHGSGTQESVFTSNLVVGLGQTIEGVSLQIGVEEVEGQRFVKVPQMEIRSRARRDGHYLNLAFSVLGTPGSERNVIFSQPLIGRGSALARDPDSPPRVTILENVYTSSKETSAGRGEPRQITLTRGEDGYKEVFDEVLSYLGAGDIEWTTDRAPSLSSESPEESSVPQRALRRRERAAAALAHVAHII